MGIASEDSIPAGGESSYGRHFNFIKVLIYKGLFLFFSASSIAPTNAFALHDSLGRF